MAGKIDFKTLLLEKGEKIVLFGAGGVMLVLAIMGFSMLTGTEDPETKARELTQTAQSLQSRMNDPNAAPDALPEWVNAKGPMADVQLAKHMQTQIFFDPIAQPESRRVNPIVLAPIEFQAEMVHAKIHAYDIVNNSIGLVVAKQEAKDKKPDLGKWKKQYGSRIKGNRPQPPQGNNSPMGPAGSPMGGGANPFGGGGSPMGPMASPMGPMNPMGGMMTPGGTFDNNVERSEVIYLPLNEDLEKRAPAGAELAQTIYPKRLVVVNAAFPYRQQLEEYKKALRLKSIDEVLTNPEHEVFFRGFNVQRKVTRPSGALVQDWSPFDYEAAYLKQLHSYKIGDTIEENDLAYVMMPVDYELVMPLPALIPGSSYPAVKLDTVQKQIKKINDSQRIPATQSSLVKKFQGKASSSSIWRGVDGDSELSSGIAGGEGAIGPMGMGPMGMRNGGGGFRVGSASPYAMGPMGSGSRPMNGGFTPMFNQGENGVAPQVSQDPLEVCLVRFIDPDIQPGNVYQYRIQMKIQNPNWKRTENVAQKSLADQEILYNPFVDVADKEGKLISVSVPVESYLYAVDMPSDRKPQREGEAMMQVQEWREQVKLNERVREPVGDWIVAEFPVQRGEYVGGRQLVKLPLWSSVAKAFLLREVNSAQKDPRKRDPKEALKGITMDFSRPDLVVVEVEGGKVDRRYFTMPITNKRVLINDESSSEILLVDSQGQLSVLNTAADQEDRERKARQTKFNEWVQAVEDATKRLAPTDGGGGIFNREEPK